MLGIKNTVVRARINEHVKEEAAAVLAAMGLTVSDAFRILLTRVANEKALPFEPLVPNEETIQAMKDARAGKVETFDTVDDLFADVGINFTKEGSGNEENKAGNKVQKGSKKNK